MALSYQWGSQAGEKTIYVNGKHKAVNPNLYDALLQLRESLAPVPLWIDAICINQADVDERNREVSKMSRIYSRAEAVLYWLGTAKEQLPSVANFDASAQLLVQVSNIHDTMCTTGDQGLENPWEVLGRGYESASWRSRLNFALLTPFDLSFWTRVWITQELVLAKDRYFFWGPYSFNMKVIDDLTEIRHDLLLGGSGREDSYDPAARIFATVMEKFLLRRRRINLQEALLNSRYRRASLAHDHVYGALGFASIGGQKIQINYGKSTKEVFLDAFRIILEQETNLDIMSTCYRGWDISYGLEGSRDDDERWPTWLPDWSYGPWKNEESSRPRGLFGSDHIELR
jgi:hypothetical protein